MTRNNAETAATTNELKHEIVAGSLRSIRTAAVPVLAAIGGVIVPAATYLLINTVWAGGEPHGWAVPAATDIAFAVTILALVGSRLPSSLRVFLLTLAVVDDLMAVTSRARCGLARNGWSCVTHVCERR